jgi:hypothetical protein
MRIKPDPADLWAMNIFPPFPRRDEPAKNTVSRMIRIFWPHFLYRLID